MSREDDALAKRVLAGLQAAVYRRKKAADELEDASEREIEKRAADQAAQIARMREVRKQADIERMKEMARRQGYRPIQPSMLRNMNAADLEQIARDIMGVRPEPRREVAPTPTPAPYRTPTGNFPLSGYSGPPAESVVATFTGPDGVARVTVERIDSNGRLWMETRPVGNDWKPAPKKEQKKDNVKAPVSTARFSAIDLGEDE